MHGLGVGSGVWWELEPPRERDELVPIVFFNAPEIFRPTPFMVGAWRTRMNKNNSSQVMLVKSNGNAYPRVVPLNVGLILQQRNEREVSCTSKWAQIQWNPERKECEREWATESECEMKNTPIPQALFKEPRVQTAGNKEGAMVSSRWPKMGPVTFQVLRS
jgi:hypothetical protein